MSPPTTGSVMGLSVLTRRWGLFAAITFALIGLMLANLRAGPVGDLGGGDPLCILACDGCSDIWLLVAWPGAGRLGA